MEVEEGASLQGESASQMNEQISNHLSYYFVRPPRNHAYPALHSIPLTVRPSKNLLIGESRTWG
jgi:hypothetical protein